MIVSKSDNLGTYTGAGVLVRKLRDLYYPQRSDNVGRSMGLVRVSFYIFHSILYRNGLLNELADK
jgi:hypothetical protein